MRGPWQVAQGGDLVVCYWSSGCLADTAAPELAASGGVVSGVGICWQVRMAPQAVERETVPDVAAQQLCALW